MLGGRTGPGSLLRGAAAWVTLTIKLKIYKEPSNEIG